MLGQQRALASSRALARSAWCSMATCWSSLLIAPPGPAAPLAALAAFSADLAAFAAFAAAFAALGSAFLGCLACLVAPFGMVVLCPGANFFATRGALVAFQTCAVHRVRTALMAIVNRLHAAVYAITLQSKHQMARLDKGIKLPLLKEFNARSEINGSAVRTR